MMSIRSAKSFHLFCTISATPAVVIFAACLSLSPVIGAAQDVPPTDSATKIADNNTPDVSVEGPVVFQKMPIDQVRTELLQWLASTGADHDDLQAVTLNWADDDALAELSGEELLDLLIASFAQVDNATQRLVQDSYGAVTPDGVVFDGIREATIFRNQVQQFRARWMVQHKFYDDALPLLTELVPESVVDPAGLLFYRAICQSQLMQRSEAIDSLSLLLNNTLDVPKRFRVVAEMLKQELTDQKEDGLNKVAQLMRDVERRLDLGRSGEKTQEQEVAIIVALDELLAEMEKNSKSKPKGGGGGDPQSQPGAQGASQSMNSGRSSSTGEADRRNLDEKGKWGMIDQKTEARARELIRQKFPSNFLDQIGRYTKKIAEQKK